MLLARIVASVCAYLVFAIITVAWVVTHDPTLKWMLFVPLILSMFALPRDVRSFDLPEEKATRVKLTLSYVRVAYFLGALILMVGLPEFLN